MPETVVRLMEYLQVAVGGRVYIDRHLYRVLEEECGVTQNDAVALIAGRRIDDNKLLRLRYCLEFHGYEPDELDALSDDVWTVGYMIARDGSLTLEEVCRELELDLGQFYDLLLGGGAFGDEVFGRVTALAQRYEISQRRRDYLWECQERYLEAARAAEATTTEEPVSLEEEFLHDSLAVVLAHQLQAVHVLLVSQPDRFSDPQAVQTLYALLPVNVRKRLIKELLQLLGGNASG